MPSVPKTKETFDFLYVVPGVAIGLTIVRVCQFLGHLLVYRPRNQTFHLPEILLLIWSVILLGLAAQYWFFTSRSKKYNYTSDFGRYLLLLVSPVLLSFMSFILCPNHDEPGFKDLGHHFIVNSPLLYVLVAAFLWSATVENLTVQNRQALAYPSENLVRVLAGAIFATFWFVPQFFAVALFGTLDRDLIVILLVGVLLLFRAIMSRYPI